MSDYPAKLFGRGALEKESVVHTGAFDTCVLTRVAPHRMEITGHPGDLAMIEKALTVKDEKEHFRYQKAKKQTWLIGRMGMRGFQQYLEGIKAKSYRSLLFIEKGAYWTYPGLRGRIEELLGKDKVSFVDQVVYPDFKSMAWEKKPTIKIRYYQEEAVEALKKAKHASVECATGVGKSVMALHLIRDIGLRTVVQVPSVSIAEQMYELFVTHLGKAKVGKFFGGKKEPKKPIVIAVAQSLATVKPGTTADIELRKAQVYLCDEGHLLAAQTLEKISLNLMSAAPYRFFVSATMMRNDGLDLVLEGIVGPKVYEYGINQAVKEGFLAPLKFKIVKAPKATNNVSDDAKTVMRLQFYRNRELHRIAANIANNAVSTLKRKVLILVEEIDQFFELVPYLKVPYRFATGSALSKEQLNKYNCLPPELNGEIAEPNDQVAAFNNGLVDLLVGTSCISMGTDTKVADFVIYMQAGLSEVKILQAIGRGTRLVPGKKDCIIVDFDVEDCKLNHRHLEARKDLYQTIGEVSYA